MSAPVYTAMTRPPVLFGASFSWVAAEGLALSILFIGSSSLWVLLMVPVVHLAGIVTYRFDPWAVELMGIRARAVGMAPLRRVLGSNGYLP
jgi:type IV secretory pathway VirB3-like protein